MKDFVVIFRHSNGEYVPTPEQLKERMEWLGGIASQNRLVDQGKTLSVTGARTLKDGRVEIDGPYVEAEQFISGFMIVKAETIDEAAELVRDNPVFKMGGCIELREALAPGGKR